MGTRIPGSPDSAVMTNIKKPLHIDLYLAKKILKMGTLMFILKIEMSSYVKLRRSLSSVFLKVKSIFSYLFSSNSYK